MTNGWPQRHVAKQIAQAFEMARAGRFFEAGELMTGAFDDAMDISRAEQREHERAMVLIEAAKALIKALEAARNERAG